MDRNFCKKPVEGSGGAPPSEAWLFAQALLGKPVPNPLRAEADARIRRERLEWLAAISPEDARRVRGQLSEEADAKAERELLEWVAQISGVHVSGVHEAQWDSAKHPRAPKGQSDGGQWVATGGSGGAASMRNRPGAGGKPRAVDPHSVPPRMVALAHAWGQTNSLLQQSRRDIERLPTRIAHERPRVRSPSTFEAPSGPFTGVPLTPVMVSPFWSPACSNKLPGLMPLTCTPTICPPSYFGKMRAWEKRADGLVARFWTSLRSTAKRFSARRWRLPRASGRALRWAVRGVPG